MTRAAGFLLIAITVAAAAVLSPVAVTARKDKRITHLEFYMHDLVTYPNSTAVVVVPPVSNTSTSYFGEITVIDDKLTSGPYANSTEIARAQGMYVFASKTSIDLLMVFTAVFPDQSTLCFHGSDRINLVTRDLAIVGGTGRFSFARGIATIRTFYLDAPNAILGFNCTIAY